MKNRNRQTAKQTVNHQQTSKIGKTR